MIVSVWDKPLLRASLAQGWTRVQEVRIKEISSKCDLSFAQTFGIFFNRDYHVGSRVINGEKQLVMEAIPKTAFEGNLRNPIEVVVLYI